MAFCCTTYRIFVVNEIIVKNVTTIGLANPRRLRYTCCVTMELRAMADDEIKTLLKQVLDFLPTLATKADVKAEVSAAEARQSARIDVLGDRVDSLGDRVDSLGGRVDSLGDRVDSLGGRVDSLGDRVDSLGDRVDSLGDKVDSLGERVGSVEATVGTLVVEVADLNAGQIRLEGDVADLKAGQTRLEGDVAEIRRVVGVNHQRTLGHIEELRAIVTDHLEGHDSRKRKAG